MLGLQWRGRRLCLVPGILFLFALLAIAKRAAADGDPLVPTFVVGMVSEMYRSTSFKQLVRIPGSMCDSDSHGGAHGHFMLHILQSMQSLVVQATNSFIRNAFIGCADSRNLPQGEMAGRHLLIKPHRPCVLQGHRCEQQCRNRWSNALFHFSATCLSAFLRSPPCQSTRCCLARSAAYTTARMLQTCHVKAVIVPEQPCRTGILTRQRII